MIRIETTHVEDARHASGISKTIKAYYIVGIKVLTKIYNHPKSEDAKALFL